MKTTAPEFKAIVDRAQDVQREIGHLSAQLRHYARTGKTEGMLASRTRDRAVLDDALASLQDEDTKACRFVFSDVRREVLVDLNVLGVNGSILCATTEPGAGFVLSFALMT